MTGRINRAFQRQPLILLIMFGGISPGIAAENSSKDGQAEVLITATSPLPALGMALGKIAAPIQVISADDFERSRSNDLSSFLNQQLGSVHVNDVSGNPLLADVNYRGYSASPLLGTPQGLSVFVDGMRLNQPFGDVVNWDLIPLNAIASMTLMPGTNPLFGLNTQGGALSIQTKDGRSNAEKSLELGLGQHGHRSLEVELGGSNAQGWDWYINAKRMTEDGWRVASPSSVQQVFAKLGWADAVSRLSLSLSSANNQMNGNGLQEQRLLAQDWHSIYTQPDITHNRGNTLNLSGSHTLDAQQQLSGSVYYRTLTTDTLNGDINADSLDQAVYLTSAAQRANLAAAGYSGYPTTAETASNTPFPKWRCIEQISLGDEPGVLCNGQINRSHTAQQNYGFSGQFSSVGKVAGMNNQFSGGIAYDASRVSFSQSSELGYLNPDHSISGLGVFADGTNAGDVDGEPYDSRVALSGHSHTWSAFATDTLSLTEHLHLTLSARYNRSLVSNRDHINPDGSAASLTGEHQFHRLNPAIGLSYTPNSPNANFTSYVSYSEGTRAPSTMELGCANPDNPCKLPNAMAGDPPLKQVVTRTFELGARGKITVTDSALNWNISLFHADNSDDILFVAAPSQSSYGYFKNVAHTRRQGLELGVSKTLDSSIGLLSFSANYTLLNATFQSHETLSGENNSSQDAEGNIQVNKGNHIPLIPRQILKLRADWQATSALSLNASLQAVSSSYARGNENNTHQADGSLYLGSGKSAGYAVVNLGATYQASAQLEFFGQIGNLFNTRYTTAAQLGATGFDANGNFQSRNLGQDADGNWLTQRSTFTAPGAPRSLWVGMKYRFE